VDDAPELRAVADAVLVTPTAATTTHPSRIRRIDIVVSFGLAIT